MTKNEMNAIDFLSKYDPYELTVYDGMTLARHHVFSAYNKAERENGNGVSSADHALLHQYKGDRVDTNSAMGVDIELRFYHRFRKSLQLVPALDCGDHTDFAGMMEGKLVRFDVTKNRHNKQPADYTLQNQYVVEWSNAGRCEKWRFYRVVPTRFIFDHDESEKLRYGGEVVDVATFVGKLNELIQAGCTEISARYVGDTENRNVLYDGCTMSGTAEQYLKIQIEQSTGHVLADYSQYPNISFRVSDTPRDEDLHVENIKADGKAAIIEVMGRSE